MAKKSKTQKQVEKAIKKTPVATIVLAFLFLIVGALVGVFVSKSMMKNDVFALNGEREIMLHIGDVYTERGAKVISFGKDISDKVIISGDTLDTSVAGRYMLVYKVDNFRYKNFQLVRTVWVIDKEADNG